MPSPAAKPSSPRVWNPFRADAVYWQGKHGRLRRYIGKSFCGHAAIVLVTMLSMHIPGCKKTYDLVKGSGKPKAMIKQMKVEVKKVQRKRVLVNANSPIVFEVPPLELTPLNLKEVTANEYKIGQGEGAGPAGYAAGREGARFVFVRVRYEGGNWDFNMRNGADENMTKEFGRRAKMPVSKIPQDVTLAELGRYVKGRAPPVVFFCGSYPFRFDTREVKAVRNYLLENRGMIFADNGGNQFHSAFLRLMQSALPEVAAVEIPDDDPIYQAPYPLNGCPPLWAHSGTRALGWKKDGRWVAFYHQGSISDAWKDTHGGTSAESAEQSYQLGVNILAQAMAGYSEWKMMLEGKGKK
ncbi:MAG: DUF4159 domain-containing protein [Proteobacteria bacterium]|nr:DUF4159 domain-containing protein [Verrucomicrobiota bacterium]NBU08853.1 DUF4159 domain-containing protein [Pseudomonadota bacterium]